MAERLTPRSTALFAAALALAAAAVGGAPGPRPGSAQPLLAEPGAGRRQERRLHELPHQDGPEVDARLHVRAPRLHGLPRRRLEREGGGHAGLRASTRRRSRRRTCCRRTARSGRRRPTPSARYTALLDEDLAFVRFMNPGDLRAAPQSCGPCHASEVKNVSKSLMTHGGDALRGRGSTTTASCPARTRSSARATGPTASRAS